MKRIISILLSLVFCLTLFPLAASADDPADAKTVLYSFGFDSDPAEEGWTFEDADGDGKTWSRSESSTYEGTGCLVSRWNGEKAVDNRAISPAVELPALGSGQTLTLSFYAGKSSSMWEEGIACYVGESTDIDEMESVYGPAEAEAGYHHYEVDISKYAGKTVYAAIRHCNAVDQFYLYLDNFEIYISGQSGTTPAAPSEMTVTFDAKGGTVTPDSKVVSPGGKYGELPTPEEREGYAFDGWFAEDYQTENYVDTFKDGRYPNDYLLRISPLSGPSASATGFKPGNILDFDITVTNTVFTGKIDINDNTLYSGFTVGDDGHRLTGSIVITSSMQNGEHTFFDADCEELPTDYTIHYFRLFQSSDEAVTEDTLVVKTDSHTLYAGWSKNPPTPQTPENPDTPTADTCTVKFDTKGGTEIDDQTVVKGEKAQKPEDPVWEPYTFGGWRLGEEDYDFDTPVENDITLTAVWYVPYTPCYVTESYSLPMKKAYFVDTNAPAGSAEVYESEVVITTAVIIEPTYGSYGVIEYTASAVDPANVTHILEKWTEKIPPLSDGFDWIRQSLALGAKLFNPPKKEDKTVKQPEPVTVDDVTPAIVEEPAEPDIPFTDVDAADPFYNAIVFAHKSGLMKGISDTEFDASGTLTRAMFVTILGRMDMIDPADWSDCPFSDCEPLGDWDYVPYVAWAAENGIVLGFGDGTFRPYDPVTNEQVVLMLQRYAEYLGCEITVPDIAFEGASPWASAAVSWAFANGIYPTEAETVFTAPAQRGWTAAAIYNLVGFLIK